MQSVQDYYDQLASNYDQNRFANSYGQYIDRMERQILTTWLSDTPAAQVIDMGCGTGRLLDFALTGVDASTEMLKVAALKHPSHHLQQSALPHTNMPDQAFAAAICFHVFMHLDEQLITESFAEIARIIQVGGRLIVDIPSKHRRQLGRRNRSDDTWHGNTDATQKDIQNWAGTQWRIRQRRGILFFPIHRLPDFARRLFIGIDGWIGKTRLSRYSSYHVYELERVA